MYQVLYSDMDSTVLYSTVVVVSGRFLLLCNCRFSIFVPFARAPPTMRRVLQHQAKEHIQHEMEKKPFQISWIQCRGQHITTGNIFS